MYKNCKMCNLSKFTYEFGTDKSTKDGLFRICKECNRLKSKNYREKNRNYNKEYYSREDVKKRQAEYMKDYNKNNKELLSIYKKKWRSENKEKVRTQKNEWIKNKEKNDLSFLLGRLIGSAIRKSFRRNRFGKSSKTTEILGCSFEEFKLYIENKFEPWMTWENRGMYNGEFNYGWDIDHIIPISSAKTEDDIIRLNHYTNLQPLCSKINRDIKKDFYVTS